MENKEPWTPWKSHRLCTILRDHKKHCDFKCTPFRTYCHDAGKGQCKRQVIHGACAFGWHGQILTKVCPTIQASREACIHGCTPTWRMCHERDKTKCRTSQDKLFCDNGWHLSFEEYMKGANESPPFSGTKRRSTSPRQSDNADCETSKAQKPRTATSFDWKSNVHLFRFGIHRDEKLTSERIEEGRAYAQRMTTNDTDNIDESYNFLKKRLELESA